MQVKELKEQNDQKYKQKDILSPYELFLASNPKIIELHVEAIEYYNQTQTLINQVYKHEETFFKWMVTS